MRPTSTKHRQSGFTIVEIVVVLAVLSILITLVFGVLFNLYQSNLAMLNSATQTNDTQTALHSIEDSLTLATNYHTTLTSVASPEGSDNDSADWDFKGTGAADRVLIAEVYATTGAADNSARQLVRPTSGGCSNPANTDAVSNTVIFFVRSETLYRRTIVGAGGCAPGVYQKQTCAPGQVGSGLCVASDAVLLANVTSFTIDYFTNTTDATPVDPYSEPNDAIASGQVASSKALRISLQTSRSVSGIMNTYQTSIRINKTNQ